MDGFIYLAFILVVVLLAGFKARGRTGAPGPLLLLLMAGASATYLLV